MTPVLKRVPAAIVRAVAYSDVFDAPLSRVALVAGLDCPASAETVDAALDDPAWASGLLDIGAEDVTLAGRGHLRAGAAERREISRRRWRAAHRAGRLLSVLPFVRYVAVSGSLSVDAADVDADIDLFLVAAQGRLWLARRMVVAVVRLAGLVGVRLCPNYLLAESALELDDRTAFVAHELAQLVPIGGSAAHATLLARNGWAAAFLPNAFDSTSRPDRQAPAIPRPGPVRRFAEWLLRAPVLDRVERWELARMRRLHPVGRAGADEARFDPERCKGHLVPNGRLALDAYTSRLAALGVPG
jgi:hypothetical protein